MCLPLVALPCPRVPLLPLPETLRGPARTAGTILGAPGKPLKWWVLKVSPYTSATAPAVFGHKWFHLTGGGLEWLSETFRLCQPLHTGSGVETLTSWIQDTWFNLAMGM